MSMQLSTYCKIFPWEEDTDYILLYSTKRASTILLEKSTLKSIEDGSLSSSDIKTLSDLGFLVPDLQKEKEEMLHFFDEANKENKIFSAVLVMNLNCNLGCKYCFEGMMKGSHYMSSETGDLFFNYAKTNYISKGYDIHIDFYGGEPLLSYEHIKYISQKLKTSSEENGLNFSSILVTNGTLLNADKAKELASLGLKSAQITIDGPKENHDQSRPFKSGFGSFDCIINNIKQACNFIKIQVGGNFTQVNYKEFPHLLDYFLDEGITPDKISNVKFAPVTKTNDKFGLPDFKEGCVSINEPWLFEASIFLREEILKRGFSTQKVSPIFCMIENNNDIVVNLDGTIYKCPGCIGWKELEIGNLKKGLKDYSKSYKLDLWKKQECIDCAYLPLCFGGCRYMSLLKNGGIYDIDCIKNYLDATLEAHIKQEIKYKLKN